MKVINAKYDRTLSVWSDKRTGEVVIRDGAQVLRLTPANSEALRCALFEAEATLEFNW